MALAASAADSFFRTAAWGKAEFNITAASIVNSPGGHWIVSFMETSLEHPCQFDNHNRVRLEVAVS